MDELRSRDDLTQRGELAAAMVSAQHILSAGEQTLKAAAALAEPNTFTVVTGQQAGLFGGPLYSQLKAISAIILARQLAQRFPDCRFVPVFWIASGDSDFEEVRRSFVLNRSGDVSAIELPQNGTHWDNEVIAMRDIGEYMPAALSDLAESLPGGEHREDVLVEVQQRYKHPYLAASFAAWMTRLFTESGLVIVEP
jgi:uncharacterized protein YllA (UPF0747 family)